ncbi:hypothetical protein G6F46_002358 [Rhizopus delemar]|uniref:mRNA stability protein n=3 Tax=Rhizopus TaxID=4842 RepID=I1CUW6_RHIO9|nr:hypothetical protein RO3G_17053 [Rhizopus delemar RA 99-880]KAG1049428.1 hypothetical protein G6F43_008243 [Rhizopus delemar]KAG1149291.1 hypothetical protein G6F36_014731 [Rhizopus arrhizus]KAG1451772.1 hypothetical protein G6F55_009016 [Rhizopus delemar]KAG1492245.1 hypothetical protein G6F54_009446 [Rhizopus delemar]|eukprot:EIE92246.1 hypothetical protein RO3G_17053 [Rhizopus delemar RA 99-880]
MSPAQRNQMDMNNLNKEERRLMRMYGKLPDRKDLLSHKFKERKYFDSGDYELTRAGKETSTAIGSQHPSPESIPHSNPVSHCPVKESPLAETNME